MKKKRRNRENYELYKEFGGKKEFYKNSLINMGFLVIKKIDLKDEEKDISNNGINRTSET